MKISIPSLFLCLAFTANAADPDLLSGNFWPNSTFEQGENLDTPTGTPTGWRRGGSGSAFCQVAQAGTAGNHALAVVDEDNRYGEWYADVSLAGRVSPGDKLDLQWFEMHDISGSEMRVTVIFFTSGNAVVGVGHYVSRGQSDGWTGDPLTSTFTKRKESIEVPEGAATFRVSLVSGGTLETTGTMLIDDLSVARQPAPILLPGNIWANSPTFESGTNLDDPAGTPDNWRRGGSETTICQVTTAAFISPTHALAVVDTNDKYGEWYSDLPLSGVARAGDTLNLQWFEMYDISAGGEMRVTVIVFNDANSPVEVKHYVVRGQSAGWGGAPASSSFVRRSDSILLPEGSAKLRVSLVSGGPLETTGIMIVDDFSVNKAAPPLPEVLPGNVWPNAGFEEGDNLDDPANATVTNWSRGGNDQTITVLSSANSVSSSHALAVIDDKAEGYGEWYGDLQLGAATAGGKVLDLQWFELFNVSSGEMRVTVLFFDEANQVVGQSHFVAQGSSAGWGGAIAGSTFTRRNEKVAVPGSARKMRISLVSGGPASTQGVMLIDNVSVAPEPNTPVALFGSFWTNPGFEEGTDLDTPKLARPTGWSRGGADVSISQVLTSAYMSSTHALAVVDTLADKHGEWYQFFDLTGKVAAGDQVEGQWWEMYNVQNGEMRVSIYFMTTANAVLEQHHFVTRDQSPGWNGDVATSFFTRRNQMFTIPANTAKVLVTLTSGGPAETTGTMIIDDLSFAKPPPPPDILAGNFWPNPTFELGTQLDKPTLAVLEGGWRRGGNHIPGDQVTTVRATSPTHALAVVDTKEDAYSEWYVQVPIEGMFAPGDWVDLQWFELYDTTGGDMRLSFYFRAADQAVIGQQHFVIRDQPEGWTGDLATSPFVKRNEQITIPEDTVFMMVAMASGGSLAVTGTMIIDDLSMRRVTNDFKLGGIVKVAQGWQLTWESKPGKVYSVESSAAVGPANFQVVPGLEAVTGSDTPTTSAVDPRSGLGDTQFYRIIELP